MAGFMTHVFRLMLCGGVHHNPMRSAIPWAFCIFSHFPAADVLQLVLR